MNTGEHHHEKKGGLSVQEAGRLAQRTQERAIASPATPIPHKRRTHRPSPYGIYSTKSAHAQHEDSPDEISTVAAHILFSSEGADNPATLTEFAEQTGSRSPNLLTMYAGWPIAAIYARRTSST
jgi:hypothetical protein